MHFFINKFMIFTLATALIKLALTDKLDILKSFSF